ncbi:MAG: hypothetical protein NTX36_10055 [Proteobacteria bacterium]|nr:hypothetical protein [Pseudomonadota bacterium]
MSITAYVDFSILDTLASSPPEKSKHIPHWQSMRAIWRKFIDNDIRLVTSGMDLEMDIILWLNSRGCCITDTMRAMEAIDEFERWDKIEKDNIRKWKRIFVFYEQIDFLPNTADKLKNDTEKRLASLIRDEVLDFRKYEPAFLPSEEDFNILNDCSTSLHLWYTDTSWKDLKRTDYQLNWEILLSALSRYGRKAVFEGDEGERNRNLFGLWNRIVGLSKKSSGKLPLEKSHIDFVLATVLKKYQSKQADRDTQHILNCIRHGIDVFMTTDDRLIEAFNEKKHIYLQYPEYAAIKLNLVSPSGLEIKLSYA